MQIQFGHWWILFGWKFISLWFSIFVVCRHVTLQAVSTWCWSGVPSGSHKLAGVPAFCSGHEQRSPELGLFGRWALPLLPLLLVCLCCRWMANGWHRGRGKSALTLLRQVRQSVLDAYCGAYVMADSYQYIVWYMIWHIYKWGCAELRYRRISSVCKLDVNTAWSIISS